MELKPKYQYTYFIYPFIIAKNKYSNFIEYIMKQDKNWKFKIFDKDVNNDLNSFFLPYVKKTLFPTIFWDRIKAKQFAEFNLDKKASVMSKMASCVFEYRVNSVIETKTILNNRDELEFDISNIQLICFNPRNLFCSNKNRVTNQ